MEKEKQRKGETDLNGPVVGRRLEGSFAVLARCSPRPPGSLSEVKIGAQASGILSSEKIDTIGEELAPR